MMIYGSVCSGIEAASVAWSPLGWRAAFLSEIDAFPRAVLQHRFPGVPLHGDFTTIEAGQYGAIDLLVGGTPCPSYSQAGDGRGLADPGGALALAYAALLERCRPRWFVWENVRGVLSTNAGRDFGTILAAMARCRYGLAYRVLHASAFGLPQRRSRVFVVGYLGDWRPPAAVLLEPASLLGVAGYGGPDWPTDSADSPDRAATHAWDRRGREGGARFEGPHQTVNLRASAGGSSRSLVVHNGVIRRLTPLEAERSMGFADGWTQIPWRGGSAPDGLRYAAIANSMAVAVMAWIGRRIAAVEALLRADFNSKESR